MLFNVELNGVDYEAARHMLYKRDINLDALCYKLESSEFHTVLVKCGDDRAPWLYMYQRGNGPLCFNTFITLDDENGAFMVDAFTDLDSALEQVSALRKYVNSRKDPDNG